MKNLKNFKEMFEAYDEKLANELDAIRKIGEHKFIKKIGKIVSIIDDITRLDFKALKHSLKNKSGFDKLVKIFTELSLLSKIMKNNDNVSFQDVFKYKFNSEEILKYLKDDDVIEYIKHDLKVKEKLETLNDLIKFLKDYNDYYISMKKAMK